MTIFNEFDTLFEAGDFKNAFNILKNKINDTSIDNSFLAEMYNLMGVCIQGDPSLDIADESGIFYFTKALELDFSNIGAHLNIIATYGTSVNSHNDINAFKNSVKYLKSINYAFTTLEIIKIKKNFRK